MNIPEDIMQYVERDPDTGDFRPNQKCLEVCKQFAQLEYNERTGDWAIRNAKLTGHINQ